MSLRPPALSCEPVLMLNEPFRSLWANTDPFQAVEQLQGEIYREKEKRRTLRVCVDGCAYFVKIHHGIGWREIFKNLLLLRLPVLGAQNELQALQRLTQVGVPSMRILAYGRRGRNPANQHSFIITEALEPSISLGDFCCNWPQSPPEPSLKWVLIREVANMVRRMHHGGVNHRDCYLCHFLLLDPIAKHPPKLALIDLHRAQTRSQTQPRWRNKDLAGLHFSSLAIGLNLRDRLRFLRCYFAAPLRTVLQHERARLQWIDHTAQQLQNRFERKLTKGSSI